MNTSHQYKVNGMTCAGCSRVVEMTLKGIEGVSDATVDLKGGTVSVSYNPEQVTPEQMRDAIHEYGYEMIV